MTHLTLGLASDLVKDVLQKQQEKYLVMLRHIDAPRLLSDRNLFDVDELNVLSVSDISRLTVWRYLKHHTRSDDLLKEIAILLNNQAFGGRKSSANGIDLEFERDDTYYLVAIKSGPNWGNSRQISKMREDFNKAKRILRTNAPRRAIEAVNGCCYGKEIREDKGDYLKLCGQSFWSFISGLDTLYLEIIEPIGREAREPNEEVEKLYAGLVNKLTGEVITQFCDANGLIDWPALVKFNSGRSALR